MARMLTEEEVERLEKQRELQRRADAATDPNARFNDTVARAQATAAEQRRMRILANPSAETDTTLRHQVLRDQELRAAHERGMEVHKGEWNTRIREAEEKRKGMENQGVGVARLRYGETNKDGKYTPGGEVWLAKQQNADKEKQRQHEKAMLGQTQKFQGTQNDAERKNRLGIARVQGRSTVEAAKAQAEARAADIASRERVAQGNIDARNHSTDMRAATAAAGQQMDLVKKLAGITDMAGNPIYSLEELKGLSPVQLQERFNQHFQRRQ